MHDLRPTARRLGALVEEVDDDQLDAPTPCPDYTVGDLLDHIGGLAVAFAEAARQGARDERHAAAARQPGAPAGRLADAHPRRPRDARRGVAATRTRGTA